MDAQDIPETAADPFEWAVVEIMGHRRLAGRVREEERFGAKMLRIDIPTIVAGPDDEQGAPAGFVVQGWTSQFYGGPALFSYTPSDEATVMRINQPYAAPYRYRLPAREVMDDEDPDYEGEEL